MLPFLLQMQGSIFSKKDSSSVVEIPFVHALNACDLFERNEYKAKAQYKTMVSVLKITLNNY